LEIDAESAYPAVSLQQMTTLDGAVIITQGTLVARPVSGSYYGQTYYATDTGTLHFWTGATWTYIALGGGSSPIGGAQLYFGLATTDPVDPDGVIRWMCANGRTLSSTAYPALFNVLKNVPGLYPGTGTSFYLPNMVGRVPVGASAISGITLGATGGEQTHTLVAAEMPTHNHSISDPDHNHGTGNGYMVTADQGWSSNNGGPGGGDSIFNEPQTEGNIGSFLGTGLAATGISVLNAGNGGAHNNMQPYLGTNYIIRVL
jgi:microcystin-dependent protein